MGISRYKIRKEYGDKHMAGKIRRKIAEWFALIDAYERIEQLESEVEHLHTAKERHESNLMVLHKDVQALKMEADILLKKSK